MGKNTNLPAEFRKIPLRLNLHPHVSYYFRHEQKGKFHITCRRTVSVHSKEKKIEAPVLSLIGLELLERNPSVLELEKKWLLPADKFIFISPEYNGSIPGVLKCLIDVTDRKVWKGKKALLTGVSKGRAGNLRGMDHLTGIMHYVGTVVHPNKLPISIVDTLFNEDELPPGDPSGNQPAIG